MLITSTLSRAAAAYKTPAEVLATTTDLVARCDQVAGTATLS